MPRRPFVCPYGWVGKRQLRRGVERQTAGALINCQPAPHMFFTGPPGTGKTELGRIIAALMRSEMHTYLPQDDERELETVIRNAKFADVVFIDEAHRLSKKQQHLLYSVIDRWRQPSQGASADSTQQENDRRPGTQPATLVLATNYPGQLQAALVNRLPHCEHFTHYHVCELKEIVRQVAGREEQSILLTGQAVTLLARASSGLPRAAVHHVEKLRNYVAATKGDALGHEVELDDVRAYLKCYRTRVVITLDGRREFGWAMGSAELHYMEALNTTRGPISKDLLSKRLGVDGERVSQIEDSVLRCGFVQKTGRGRELSAEGRDWLDNSDLIYKVDRS